MHDPRTLPPELQEVFARTIAIVAEYVARADDVLTCAGQQVADECERDLRELTKPSERCEP